MSTPALLVLKDQFQRSFAAAGLAVPQGVFEALAERYSEPQRAYHTLQHISECLGHLKSARNAPPSAAIALWFHDAICDPRRSDNEERSAAWAGVVLDKAPIRKTVEAMIIATKQGSVAPDPAARLVVDIDLAILAAPEPRFSEYEMQIRREYTHLDDAAYKAERFKMLRNYSDRTFIYASPEFRDLETRARKNLERLINRMITAKS